MILFPSYINFDDLPEISKRELSYAEILPVDHRKRPLFTVNYPDRRHYNNPGVSLVREPRFARIKMRTVAPTSAVNAPDLQSRVAFLGNQSPPFARARAPTFISLIIL